MARPGLFRLAEATLENLNGVVKEIVFPVVNEATLRDLVKEWKSTGQVYRYHVQTVIRSSYQSHDRRMLPKLLQTLEFRSNNATLIELGKARRTIFLCRYLRLPELRREIQEGLNVVENWNSANDFILIGKGREIAANRQEDQEVTKLALYLLQNAMVYINTLMIQRVLSENEWMERMTAEDFRALMPLIYGHISPYGTLAPLVDV